MAGGKAAGCTKAAQAESKLAPAGPTGTEGLPRYMADLSGPFREFPVKQDPRRQLQMEAKAGGLPKSPLVAKSENIFLLKAIGAEIEFVRDKNKVIQLIVHFNGQNQVAKKVK
jgi:hypothetical protein